MLKGRDGGWNGFRIPCEDGDTAYNTVRGVECSERRKGAGPSEPAVWNPLSTGITYALIERATADKAPIISMGYGRADASDGRVFPYVFRSEEHTSELQSLMRISYAVFCLKKKKQQHNHEKNNTITKQKKTHPTHNTS